MSYHRDGPEWTWPGADLVLVVHDGERSTSTRTRYEIRSPRGELLFSIDAVTFSGTSCPDSYVQVIGPKGGTWKTVVYRGDGTPREAA